MEKYIVDERTGLKYELVGDYYLIAGDEEPAPEPIGIWGQRHGRYLREHKRCIYDGMLLTGRLDSYLREIDRQAEEIADVFGLDTEDAKHYLQNKLTARFLA